jgi:DNA replication protein DnaC
VLVLDDMGTQSGTAWAQEKLFQILNHRYNAQLATVVTTNLGIDRLDERLRMRLTDPELARVITSRPRRAPSTSTYRTRLACKASHR